MKKKFWTILTSLLALVILAACGTTTNTASSSTSSSEAATITLTVVFSDSKTDTKEVTIEDGETVMEVLKENHQVEETGGMVTSIDSVSQDTATSTYWMYDVNNELASKGAAEMTVSDGDVVKFYLETYQ